MNVITRGARNALRSPVRSGAMVIMLAASIGLMLAMLVAHSSIVAKIAEVKASAATQITINPAGVMGGLGSGDYLSADQLSTIQNTAHITAVTSTLNDQLGTDDTNLTPSLELGNFGKRQMRFETHADQPSSGNAPSKMVEFKPRTTAIGTTNPPAITSKGTLEGDMIDGNGSDNVALVGKNLATKNNLSVGSTFTAYGQTFTVKGIYTLNNGFQDNSFIVPLKTLQTLSGQANAISTIEATVDSSDNVAGTVSALKSALGDKADITSQQEQAKNSVKPLENIASLALTGVIGAAITGAVIVLLLMIIVVRERKREIGVIKAIGGTNLKVISQFIVEAMTIMLISAIIGLGAGIAVSGPITQSLATSQSGENKPTEDGPGVRRLGQALGENLHTVTSTVTPQTFLMGLGITVLITIIGSAIPAWLIARVRPSEILRSE